MNAELLDDLLEKLQPGTKLKHTIGGLTPNPPTYTWYVVAIVDNDTQVVLKQWSRKKQRWIYFVESLRSV